MERLRIVLFIAASAATALTSPAQLSGFADPATVSVPAETSFAVIGDVRHVNCFLLSEGHPVTVRQAVLNAGVLTDANSVSVLRGSQDRALWTQMMTPDSADSGELVANGDVLVVQSITPVTEPIPRSAALRTDIGIIVVTLADDSVTIGDLLQQTNSILRAGQQVKIISQLQGRPTVAGAALSDKVIHGDVIVLSGGGRNVRTGFGGMAPAFSEWRDTTSAFLPPESAAESAPLTIEAPDVPADAFAKYALQIPDLYNSAPIADDACLSADPPSADVFLEGYRSENNGLLEVLAVSETSPADDQPDSSDQSAPIPPAEQPLWAASAPTTVSSGISPWNLVFIGGLLIAGTLILASSLKSDVDTDATTGIPAELLQHLQTSGRSLSAGNVTRHSSSPLQVAEKTAATANEPRTVQVSATFADSSDDKPVRADNVLKTVMAENRIIETEWFSGEWQSVNSAVAAEPVAAAPTADPDAPNAMADNAAVMLTTGQFSDLEDLLQNRLPIDLCITRLPLRISLYGRPAGPRRLRIDAAHSPLTGPHTNIAIDRRREDSAAGRGSVTTSGNASTNTAGGPDTAFHSLQERIDS